MKRQMVLTTGLALGLLVLVWCLLGSSPSQAAPACARFVVNPGGVDTGNCSSATCRTVQYAVRQAATNDLICVADRSEGGYPGPSVYTRTIVLTKTVRLNGAWTATCIHPGSCAFVAATCAPQNVVLDGQGLGRVISMTGKITPTIDCFTITNGDANGLRGDSSGFDAGGGIYGKDASPIIINNIITHNYGCNTCSSTYGMGGGIYLVNASTRSIVSNNLIANNAGANTILGWGGGIVLMNSNVQVLSNTIQRNFGGTAGDGGGVYVIEGSPIISGNKILTNTAAFGVVGAGGGIYVSSTKWITIERNLVQFNLALNSGGYPSMPNLGGGLYFRGPNANIRSNTFRDNTATLDETGYGGGVYLHGLSVLSIVNLNVIDDNRASYDNRGDGGGLYLDSSQGSIKGNRISNNIASSSGTGNGGGIFINRGGGFVLGNIITDNLALLGAVTGLGNGGGVAISNSLVTLQDNQIIMNEAASAPSSTGVGGGVFIDHGRPRLTGNQILSNTTGSGTSGTGGGIFAVYASPWLDRNTILANIADGSTYNRGGGVRINVCPVFTLTNNIIARNSADIGGSGVAIADSIGQLVNNTIGENRLGDGTGVRIDTSSVVTLTNNIIFSQSIGISNTGSTVSAVVTLFESNKANTRGSVSSVHEVPGPAALQANYHLKHYSNAIDQGWPFSWLIDDVDGDTRPIGLADDIGADEAGCNRFVLNTDGSDTSNACSDPQHPCRTVQRALDQAADGDKVCVADNPLQPGPSIYTGTNTLNKSLYLDGAWQAACVDPSDLTCAFTSVACSPANVVLDAKRAGQTLLIDAASFISTTIRCFTITGGQAGSGGGLYAHNTWAIIANNIFTNNVATAYGGGLYITDSRTDIKSNSIISNSATWGGGGLKSLFGTMDLSHNTFVDNQATYGGGLEAERSDITATNNLFINNQASSVLLIDGPGGYQATVINNVVAHNGGTAFDLENDYIVELIHNTIVSNTALGINGNNQVTLTLLNNLIAGNANAGVTPGAVTTITHNLFWHNGSDPITGTFAVIGDPRLAVDGYHLLGGSAAIGTGELAGVYKDIDNEFRHLDAAPDIGADEFIWRVYLPLVLKEF